VFSWKDDVVSGCAEPSRIDGRFPVVKLRFFLWAMMLAFSALLCSGTL